MLAAYLITFRPKTVFYNVTQTQYRLQWTRILKIIKALLDDSIQYKPTDLFASNINRKEKHKY